MADGIEMLPPASLLDMLIVLLNNGQLRAVDLVSLELSSSSMFRAPCVVAPYESMSIAASAARHACQMHPVFKIFLPQPSPQAQSELLARCDGNWKLVLHFLEGSQHSQAWSRGGETGNKVLTAAGTSYSLIVNEKGLLYACGTSNYGVLGQEPVTWESGTANLISLPSTSKRIVQISSSLEHAAFVTEIGQVYTFGVKTSCCCGVGESGQAILKPTCVTSLEGFLANKFRQGVGLPWQSQEPGKCTRGGVATVVNSAMATLGRALWTNLDL